MLSKRAFRFVQEIVLKCVFRFMKEIASKCYSNLWREEETPKMSYETSFEQETDKTAVRVLVLYEQWSLL